MNNMHLN